MLVRIPWIARSLTRMLSSSIRRPVEIGGVSLVKAYEIEELVKKVPFAGIDEQISVLELRAGMCKLKLVPNSSNLRPGPESTGGKTVSGPTLFALADLAMWTLVLTTRGMAAAERSVTTSATINFLRRPLASEGIVVEGRIDRDGRRLVVGTLSLYPEGRPSKPVATVTATYGVPPVL